jgi:hypothetical protein
LTNPALPSGEVEVDHKGLGETIARQLYPGSAPGGEKLIRLSGLGKCRRAQALSLRGVPSQRGDTPDGVLHSKLAFIAGDMAEITMVLALAEALVAKSARLRLGQVRGGSGQGGVRLSLDLAAPPEGRTWGSFPGVDLQPSFDGGAKLLIEGHPDGLLVADGKPVAVLEVKTTKSYKADKWRAALSQGLCPWGVDEDYWYQIQAYMECLDLPAAYILVQDKEKVLESRAPGHEKIFGWWMRRDTSFPARITEHLAPALYHSDEEDPVRAAMLVDTIHPSGVRLTPGGSRPPCQWCDWRALCGKR